jgi:hypothetical protein
LTNLEITFPAEAFVRVTSRAADGSLTYAKSAAQKAVERHQGAMIRSFRGYTGTKGDQLQRRSGTLKRSFGVSKDPNAPSSFVAGALYAKLQELGGTVKPTGGRQYLTIPLSAALTPGGVFREGARMVNRGGGWQTRGLIPGQQDHRTWIHKGVIFTKSTRGKPMALFALRRSVKVPPCLRFFATWEGQEADRTKDYEAALDKGTQEAVR